MYTVIRFIFKGTLIYLFFIKIQVLTIRKQLFSKKRKSTKLCFEESKLQALHKDIELFESQNVYEADAYSNRNTEIIIMAAVSSI